VEPDALAQLDPDTGAVSVLRRSRTVAVDLDYISRPEAVEFLTADGPTTQALYYRPKDADFRGPDDERQPLLVKSHGGPAAARKFGLRPVGPARDLAGYPPAD
jgi:dipeptidyl aminopeptidase/acylaminoacyl peptidase